MGLVAAVAACGGGGGDAVVVDDRGDPRSEAATRAVPEHDADPGEILTLTSAGTATHLVTYDSYPEKRDYSFAVILATLEEARVHEAPSDDGLLSRTIEYRFALQEQVGGVEAVRTDEDGTVSVVLPLDGDAETTERVLARMEPLMGNASYLLFLVPAAVDGLPDAYAPSIQNGPPGILAVWPGDGRLSPIQGGNDLELPAIERGEDLTGTSSPPEPPIGPDFSGEAPIGWTVDEVLDSFAAEVGTSASPPPAGWDAYLQIVDDVRSGS